jgi:hypothetical protein
MKAATSAAIAVMTADVIVPSLLLAGERWQAVLTAVILAQ